MQQRNPFLVTVACGLAIFLFCGFGLPFKKKKYEAPITKDTLQPDKVLFDRAIKNIEKGSYEVARLTLNTLINTYDTSEYLAKAKLAIADSWYREGGSHGLAQAEAEYKDFILFYPQMEEAAQSQYKICSIHYKQMEKSDRDAAQAQRAEDECRQVLIQFPNSKYTKESEQMVRNVQEVLADKEYRTGFFYHNKGSFPAAANRLSFLTQQYPLYSGSDEALWRLADAYRKMGDRFEPQETDALSKIVKEYPLSSHVEAAKERLGEMQKPVPAADPAAAARMKFEMENRVKPSMMSRTFGLISGKPDTSTAAKQGAPAMANMRPPVPVSVPSTAAGTANGISDVVGGVVSDTQNLDSQRDARLGTQPPVGPEAPPAAPAAATGDTAAAPTTITTPTAADQNLPSNHPYTKKQLQEIKKAQDKAAKQKKKADAAPGATPKSDSTPK